ncbi:hypothetical protein JCM19047_1741 [Bacillus sp. JCM 19047]|nr:hypothetical protein JCM19047_1741 [Bacillus sp. JCM 19047]
MALRLTSIILHGLLAVLALVIGLTALYYPSNIYVEHRYQAFGLRCLSSIL